MAKPIRRPLDFQSLEELTADVEQIRRASYEQRGQWSLEQIVEHLTITMNNALDGSSGLPRPVRFFFRIAARRMLRTRSMPRMPAPKFLKPPAVVSPDVFDRFDAVVGKCRALNGETIDHPAFGRISVDDWKQLQLIHASRHLSFLMPKSTATASD